jgi:hypothetical protein
MTEILGAGNGEEGYEDSQICAIRRRWKDSDVAMLFNISSEDRTVAMPEGYQLVDWVNATDAKNAVSEKDQILSLPAYSIAILSPDSGTK